MKKRWFSVLSILAILANILLAGCSSGKSSSDASPKAGGDTNGGNKDAVEVVWWHMEEPPNRVKVFNKIVDDFNKANPGIKIKPQVQSWGDAYSKFPAAIKSGKGPDLLLTEPSYTTLIKGELDAVQPVDDIIKAQDEKHHFISAAVDPYKYDGHVWAVPVYGMVQMLWYRKDIFQAEGLQPPKTWDELLHAAEVLTKNGRYGIALPASKSMATDQVIYSFMITSGAKDIIDGKNTVTFDNPKTVRAYDLYQKLMKFSPPDSNTYQWGEPQAQFNSGKAAMAIEKGQYLTPFEKESGRPSSDLGVVPVPTPTEGGEKGSIYYSNGLMVLTKDAKKKEAIAKFFDYLFDPKIYGEFINAEPGLFLPVTETGAKSDTFLNNEIISKYKEQVNALNEASKHGYLFGFTNGIANKIGQIAGPDYLAQTLQKILSEKMPPADAVKWGQQQMKEAVK